MPRVPAPPHGPSGAKCACPVRAACPRPASAPPLLAVDPRASRASGPLLRRAPRGHSRARAPPRAEEPGAGTLRASCDWLTWRLRVWPEKLGEGQSRLPGCAGRISGKRVGWEVWAIREREGWVETSPGISGRSLLGEGEGTAQELHRVNAGPVRPAMMGLPRRSACVVLRSTFSAGFRHLPLFLITRVLQLSFYSRFVVVVVALLFP